MIVVHNEATPMPAGHSGFRLLINDDWRDERTGTLDDLVGRTILRTRQRPDSMATAESNSKSDIRGTKKAGRFPIREYEGPTKNLIP